jgi:hypothetical protein
LENLVADEMMELTSENMDTVNLSQKMDNWHVILNTITELHFPYNSRIYFCQTNTLLVSEEGFCSMYLVIEKHLAITLKHRHSPRL